MYYCVWALCSGYWRVLNKPQISFRNAHSGCIVDSGLVVEWIQVNMQENTGSPRGDSGGLDEGSGGEGRGWR